MTLQRSVLLVALAAALIASACHFPIETPMPDYDSLRRDMQQHRRLWESQGIQNYEFEYERTCFCFREPPAGHLLMSVCQGELVRAKVIDSSVASTGLYLSADLLSDYPTIPGLFDLLARTIEERAAEQIRIVWNESEGWPVEISVDYVVRGEDDEFTVRVLSVVPFTHCDAVAPESG